MWKVPSSLVLLLLLQLACSLIGSVIASVSYDSKAITINGQRRILISGSIHYPRSTPEVLLYNIFIYYCRMSLRVVVFYCFSHIYIYIYIYIYICVFYITKLVFLFIFSDVARSYTEG